MHKVRLLYVTTVPLTQYLLLRGQNAFLAGKGFELHTITSPGEELDRLIERDNVIAHPVPIDRAIRPLRDLVSLVRIANKMRRIRPDIVHLSTPKAALLGAIAAWALRVPVRVFLVRGLSSEAATGPVRRLYQLLERLTALLSTDVVCIAPSLLRYAYTNKIIDSGTGVVIGNGMSNGIDTRRFDPDVVESVTLSTATSVKRWIGFVGRLAADKGLEEIAIAWRTIRKLYPDSGLILVGHWETHDSISPKIRREFEADPRVVLPGAVADVRPWLRAMNVFLFPPRGAEGFPNAPMEASAMGLPVVATRVVGCLDAVVDGVTGILVPSRDPDAIVRAVSWYFDHPGAAVEHGCHGRKRVIEKFAQESVWKGMYQYYIDSLRRHDRNNTEFG